jgi:hypothetical protein
MALSLTASRHRLFRAIYVVAVGVAMIGWVWMIFEAFGWALGA